MTNNDMEKRIASLEANFETLAGGVSELQKQRDNDLERLVNAIAVMAANLLKRTLPDQEILETVGAIRRELEDMSHKLK